MCEMKGIHLWEIGAITALTILFLGSASHNLGSFTMPSSVWQPSATAGSKEAIYAVFDLGTVQHLF
jgi:hypothetical protein